MKQVASYNKIGFHKERIRDYINGEPILPITLEFDITSQCTRACQDCPSSRSDFKHNLPIQKIENLFDSLERQTKGMLMTGGEVTMSPDFYPVTKMALKKGFEEISVVTNGSLLHEDRVINTLLENVSVVRISMYDWENGECENLTRILKKIENLRNLAEKKKSKLQIGTSILTSREQLSKLIELSENIKNAGAHWSYYHPKCTGWNTGHLRQFDQTNVLGTIEQYGKQNLNGFQVFISKSRYKNEKLNFSSYHAAHFLMIVGADGINYLGAEVKYQDKFALTNIFENWEKTFMRRKERLEKINSINSENYISLNSRHRGVLYNDLIEKIINGKMDIDMDLPDDDAKKEFMFPNIL